MSNEIDETGDPEEGAWEAKLSDLRNFALSVEREFPPELHRAVSEAGYSFSEMGAFADFEGRLSTEQMIQIWGIVETIRRDGDFPADLRM